LGNIKMFGGLTDGTELSYSNKVADAAGYHCG
jgi:hypothetical protein